MKDIDFYSKLGNLSVNGRVRLLESQQRDLKCYFKRQLAKETNPLPPYNRKFK